MLSLQSLENKNSLLIGFLSPLNVRLIIAKLKICKSTNHKQNERVSIIYDGKNIFSFKNLFTEIFVLLLLLFGEEN